MTENRMSNLSVSAGRPPSNESLEVVRDWLSVYAAVWREEITEELIAAYWQVVQTVPARLLHKAFEECLKTKKFRPVPADVLEVVAILKEKNEMPRLPPHDPELTAEEKADIAVEIAVLKDKIGEFKTMSPIDIGERRKFLKQQAAEILREHPPTQDRCLLCEQGVPKKEYFDKTIRHFDGLMAWSICTKEPAK